MRLIVSDWLDAQIGFLSAGMAFFTILSLLPFLAVIFSVARMMGRLNYNVDRAEVIILRYLTPAEASELLAEVSHAIDRLSGELVGFGGFVLGFLILTGLLSRLDHVVQRIWEIDERSSLWRSLFLFLIEIFVVVPLIIFAIGGILTIFSFQDTWLESVTPLALTFTVTFSIYRFLPRGDVTSGDAVLPAAVVSLVFIFGKNVFFWLTGQLFDYNRVYGSLAALPLFFLWIYVLWFFFLLGVLATKVIHQTRWGNIDAV